MKSKILPVKQFLNLAKLLFSFLIILLMFNCSERNNNDSTEENFCNVKRTFHSEVQSKEGTLVFLSDEKKYAIKYYPILPTIDKIHLYILCLKPNNISENESVKFSCNLYKFNNDEKFNPTVGGTEFYFASNLNIIKL